MRAAAAASELSAATREDVNSQADLLRRNAKVMLCDVLLIHYSYSGHYYSIVCGAKMGSLALNTRL